MTEQELARRLLESGRLNREHVEYAAQQRTPDRSFAQVLVDLGWISREEILQIDPNAFDVAPPASTSPAATMPLPTSAPPPGADLPGQTPPPMSGAGYGAPAPGVAIRPAEVTFDHIGRAWALLQQQMGTWIGATLVVFVISGIVGGIVGGITGSMAGAPSQPTPDNPFGTPASPGPGFFLMQFISSLVNWVISTVLVAGLYRMAIKQIRGEAISVGDMFSTTDVLGNLLIASILTGLATAFGLLLCCVGALVVSALLILTIPLIVDKRIGAVEAMSLSWNALKGQALMATLFVFVVAILGSLGILLCGIGIVLTFPLMPLAIGLLYHDFFPSPASGATSSPQSPYPPPPIPRVQ